MIVALPFFFALITPLPDTVATDESDVEYLTFCMQVIGLTVVSKVKLFPFFSVTDFFV